MALLGLLGEAGHGCRANQTPQSVAGTPAPQGMTRTTETVYRIKWILLLKPSPTFKHYPADFAVSYTPQAGLCPHPACGWRLRPHTNLIQKTSYHRSPGSWVGQESSCW